MRRKLALEGRTSMTTGANEDDFHLRGVDVARDVAVGRWLDLREVKAGEACPMCGGELAVQKTIEIGHIFKLGTRYEMLGATVLDDAGIRTGDVLLSINEISLNSPYALMELYPRIQEADEIRVLLERDGEVKTLVYSFD